MCFQNPICNEQFPFFFQTLYPMKYNFWISSENNIRYTENVFNIICKPGSKSSNPVAPISSRRGWVNFFKRATLDLQMTKLVLNLSVDVLPQVCHWPIRFRFGISKDVQLEMLFFHDEGAKIISGNLQVCKVPDLWKQNFQIIFF